MSKLNLNPINLIIVCEDDDTDIEDLPIWIEVTGY